MTEPVLWSPHPGPQTRFLEAAEFEALYGGAAGGGKSDALLFGALRQIDQKSYRALILRHTYPELAELIDRAHGLFPLLGGVWNEQKKRWTFRTGAVVEFGYCEVFKDVQRYQGQQFSYIGFDEIGNLAEERIWSYLMSRCRSGGPSIRPMMRASANPGGPGHAWLKRRFVEVCGVDGATVYKDADTGLTRRFVPARLKDNPTLLANNPQYEAQLRALPEMLRRQLLDGDWDAGAGMALGELNRAKHFVERFEIPAHWTQFGAFDWGFAHPFSFGWYCVSEDGTIYKVDTVTGRHLLPHEIHERIAERVPLDDLNGGIDAGHDLWSDIKARGEQTPTLYEQFRALGWKKLRQASIARKSGLNNFRQYVTWRDGVEPRFKFMDTPANQRCFEQLAGIVSDPDDPEDALKVDADPNTGEGGDDSYDETRYALASRPILTKPIQVKQTRVPNVDPAFALKIGEYEKQQARRKREDDKMAKRLLKTLRGQ